MKPFVFMMLWACLLSTATLAQNTDQPDPLRPSAPDSTKKVTPAADTTATALGQDDEKELDDDDTTHVDYRFRFTADGTFTSGNVSRSLLQLVGSFDLALSHIAKLSTTPSFVYGRQSGTLNEREYFGDARVTFFHEKRLYYLAFGAYEKSNLRQILNRYTVAAGLGYKLLSRQRAYISLTDVLLHENTDFAQLNDINVWRNSARLFGEYTFGNDQWSISHTTFYQPALSRQPEQPLNVRWNASISLQYKFSANLSFRTTFANSYESVVVPGRVNNDTRLTLGMTYEKK
ncbi:DUF481 domain-containing protein [Fibrella sp. HMF5335]|uniref:DUF481 domain-containing protein n=1 Tax=Fibrella rubiginis TaxID=2817060 RepID=A0A939GFB6_9BACT|nr:DUF481 domain-containing protein [Fibrella rubiginis]MBO0935403.1 DUF481 domain-containing protein [Fibrella rubiginis]